MKNISESKIIHDFKTSSWLPLITILSPLDIKLRSLNFFFKFLTISNSLLKKSDG